MWIWVGRGIKVRFTDKVSQALTQKEKREKSRRRGKKKHIHILSHQAMGDRAVISRHVCRMPETVFMIEATIAASGGTHSIV
jgi:hypothetical protein